MKKLKLTRETVRRIDAEALQHAVGGSSSASAYSQVASRQPVTTNPSHISANSVMRSFSGGGFGGTTGIIGGISYSS